MVRLLTYGVSIGYLQFKKAVTRPDPTNYIKIKLSSYLSISFQIPSQQDSFALFLPYLLTPNIYPFHFLQNPHNTQTPINNKTLTSPDSSTTPFFSGRCSKAGTQVGCWNIAYSFTLLHITGISFPYA